MRACITWVGSSTWSSPTTCPSSCRTTIRNRALPSAVCSDWRTKSASTAIWPLTTLADSGPDGAIVVGEPDVAATWFPSNDHPRDAASVSVSATVPKELEAVSNGVLVDRDTADEWERCNQRLFRDALLRDPDARARYGAAKEALAAAEDGRAYTAGKRVIVEEILNDERARRGLPPTSAWDK